MTNTSLYIKNTQFYYMIKLLFLTVKQQFQMFGNKVLTNIFVPRGDEVKGGNGKVLHKKSSGKFRIFYEKQRHCQSIQLFVM
jgi:mRNA-degrading endonuclease RelE of RelBE toxin-antitoxin system